LLSAFHAKVIAALQGVQVALNLGVSTLTMETNALTLQQELAAEAFCAKPEVASFYEFFLFCLFIQVNGM